MTVVLSDNKWERCLDDARSAATMRGTEHGFVDFFAKALYEDRQILFCPGVPETKGDLEEVSTDIGPMLVVYVGESLAKATLTSKISKQANIKGTWISAGRGSKKETAYVSKITHHSKPGAGIRTAVHQRKPSGFAGEEGAIRAQIAAKPAQTAKEIQRGEHERVQNAMARMHQHTAVENLAPATTFEELEGRAAGMKPLRMNQKTGEPYMPPGPYDRWVTVHPWGDGGEGQPVLITQVPGHKGRYMTVREPGEGRQRFREIRTITPEDQAKEAVERRKKSSQQKFEEFVTGRQRAAAEFASPHAQAKFSVQRRGVEARLGMRKHQTYGPCTNPSCVADAKAQHKPAMIHLFTPEVARAAIQKRFKGQTISEDLVRNYIQQQLDRTNNWLNKHNDLERKRHEGYANVRLGTPVDDRELAESEAEKALRLAAGTANAIANSERRMKHIEQDIKTAHTPAEKQMAMNAYKEATRGLLGLETELQEHRLTARMAADRLTSMPAPQPQLKAERAPADDLAEMAQRSSSLEEFVARHDYYRTGIEDKIKEYTEALPSLIKQLADVRSGKATGAPPGRTGVWQEVGSKDEKEETGRNQIAPASAAMKAKQMESELNRSINVARIMVQNFSSAARALEENTLNPNTQRKLVNYALEQEQQDAGKVIATARIKGAAEKSKEEGKDKRATMIEMAKPGAEHGILTPEQILEDTALRDKFALASQKYKRDKRTAEQGRGLTMPMSPHYGDLTTEQVAKARVKDIQKTVEDLQTQRAIVTAFAPWEAIDILGEDRDNVEKKVIVSRHQEGMYSAFHTVSVGTAMEGLVDPAVVNILGQEGTAGAMASWLQQNAPDKVDLIKERLQKWTDTQSDKHVSDVLELYDQLIEESRELKAAIQSRTGTNVPMPEIHGMNKQLERRARQAISLAAHALGQENAVNSLLGALKGKGKPTVQIALSGIKDVNEITTRMAALRMSRGVKEGEGDYTTRKAGDQWLADIKYDSLAKAIHKTHEPIFSPEVIQEVEEIKDGVRLVGGKPVFLDDPQYLPPLFSARQVGRLYGEEKALAMSRLADLDPKNAREKLGLAIGVLGLHGMGHRDIREYLNRDAVVNDYPKSVHEAYRKALAQLLPGSDGSHAADRKARSNLRDMVKKIAAERGGDIELHSQELDPVFAARHLRNAFLEAPHHVLAYKDLDQLGNDEKDMLKRFWADNVAGANYGGRDEDTDGKAAWRYFMKKAGGESEALAIVQELLRDEHMGRLTKHMAASETRMTIGDKPIKNANLLDEVAYKGPLAGLRYRRTLGDRAEAQLQQMARGDAGRPGLAANFRANQPPHKPKGGHIQMYGDFVRQQRAIRQFALVKRMAVLTEPGSGKTATALGGYTELRQRALQAARAKGEKAKFRSVWVVPATLIDNDQINGELSSFLAENSLKWHAKPLEGDERFRQRVALMKDPSLDIYVASHETLRDDLLRILSDFKEVGGSTRFIEGRGKLLDKQTRESLVRELEAADPAVRSKSMTAALKMLGIEFQHMFVDEGHRISNRPGKRESQMSSVVTALADGTPNFMLGTASPAENDFGEVLDLLRKIRPETFGKRERQDPELRTPYEHIVRAYQQLASQPRINEVERAEQADIDVGLAQALRREIAPAVFNVPQTTGGDIEGEFSEEHVTLTPSQKKAVDLANAHAATARSYWSNPVGATRSLRTLAPQRFASIDEADAPRNREVAEQLLAHVETLRRNALERALHTGGDNAKTQKLVSLVKNDPRLRSPKTGRPSSGVVFVNLIQSARDVAKSLNESGVEAYPITSQENPANVKKWEERYRATQGKDEQVVLVVSPTGSEGKEYQAGAWTMHYDLPHSSYKLRQREGRINRAGQTANRLHNIRLVAHNDDGTKHELEQARERVIQSKAPLMGLFEHEKVSRDDTDLAHLLSLREMVRPKPMEENVLGRQPAEA